MAVSPRDVPHPSHSAVNHELIWKMYKEVAEGERHFNHLQSIYRRIAALWLLASFAAIGSLLSGKLQVGTNAYPLAMLIFTAAAAGFLLLWCVDLLVYHRLLDSHFYEGLRLEREHEWLPRIRHNMRSSPAAQRLSRRGVLSRAAMFYAVPVFVCLELSAFSLGATLSQVADVASLPKEGTWRASVASITVAVPWAQSWAFGAAVALGWLPLNTQLYTKLCTRVRNPQLAAGP